MRLSSKCRMSVSTCAPGGGIQSLPLLLLFLNAVMGFKLCPSHCLCYESSDLVDCRSRGLTSIPTSVPHGTWLLDLSGNTVTEVRSRAFTGLWSLKILLISNSSIQTLHPQSLSSLQFLERLDLSYNSLQNLPEDFSESLSSLQELKLDHNLLQHLGSSSLGDFENLRKLDLSHNHISDIDVRAFDSLSRLIILNLEENKLNVVRDQLLSRQQSLEVLMLNHNNISRIDADALSPLRSLVLLGLRGNKLDHIRFKTFLELHTTSTHLQLSSNPWTCDCELQRVFSKIQHVRHLRVLDYKDIICHAPPQQAGLSLSDLDSQLCMAETVSVLVITITVLLAVVGTLMKAERNRKKKLIALETEAQKLEK